MCFSKSWISWGTMMTILVWFGWNSICWFGIQTNLGNESSYSGFGCKSDSDLQVHLWLWKCCCCFRVAIVRKGIWFFLEWRCARKVVYFKLRTLLERNNDRQIQSYNFVCSLATVIEDGTHSNIQIFQMLHSRENQLRLQVVGFLFCHWIAIVIYIPAAPFQARSHL